MHMKKLLLLLMILFLPVLAHAELEAHFLDVGHGDCTILLSQDEAAVINGGPASASDMVFAYLRKLGVTQVQYVFAMQTHPDCTGGLPAAFHASAVQELIIPPDQPHEGRFGTLLEKAADMSVPCTSPVAGDQFPLGDAVITVLEADPRNGCLTLQAASDSMSILFLCGASMPLQSEYNEALAADVLRISDPRGSAVPGSGLIRAISPEYAVISCAELAHAPDPAVMNLLLNRGVRVLCTDYTGTAVITGKPQLKMLNEPVCQRWYVGNINSSVFHRHSCSSVKKMKESNKYTLYSTEEAEYLNFRPCKNCSP